MKEFDIDQLLRQRRPQVSVPLGLATRIRANCRAAAISEKRFSLAWLSLPAVALVVLALFLAQPKPEVSPVVMETPQLVPSLEAAPELELNPLRSEALALRHDAERTGRFLLDCLPVLTMNE